MHRINLIVVSLARTLYWRIGLETVTWIAALTYLAIHNPYVQSTFSICPLENLGFHYCPGCGLGRSVSFILHGDVMRSVETHLLGIPAAIIIIFRTFSLLKGSLRWKVLDNSVH